MHSKNLTKAIRSAARAIIIENNSVLMVQMKNEDGEFFILPGGGQVHGETLVQAVERECMEELGILVSVGRLVYTREYIGKNHQFDQSHDNFHQIEHVFMCEITNGTLMGNGHEMDKKQIGYRWIQLNELSEYKVLPTQIKSLLQTENLILANNYLGDVN